METIFISLWCVDKMGMPLRARVWKSSVRPALTSIAIAVCMTASGSHCSCQADNKRCTHPEASRHPICTRVTRHLRLGGGGGELAAPHRSAARQPAFVLAGVTAASRSEALARLAAVSHQRPSWVPRMRPARQTANGQRVPSYWWGVELRTL